jgi:CRP-like cAMP-binding protein
MSATGFAHFDNYLLAHLSSADQDTLAPLIRTQRVPAGTALTRRFRPVSHAWFPQAGLVSMIASMHDGRSAEAASVGGEGGIGLEAALESPVALSDAVVQIGGDFSVIRVDQLRSAIDARPTLRNGLGRYLHALHGQLAQSVACSSLHGLEERCCRWLMTAQDRSGADELPVTQETLATMLGAGRPRVNSVLRTLEQAGLIRRRRVRITIQNREGLLARTCECYQAVRKIFRAVGLKPGRG